MEVINIRNINVAGGTLGRLISSYIHQKKKVVWFVSGGSSIPIASIALKKLLRSNANFLCVMLVDDKFDKKGEGINDNAFRSSIDDSGWLGYAPMKYSVDIQAMSAFFNKLIDEKIKWADILIGQFGIGDGYHTGGILPQSDVALEQESFSMAYEKDGFSCVTITPALISKLDIVFINSFGESKRRLIRHFLKSKATIFEEPTQSLKEAKKCILVSDVLAASVTGDHNVGRTLHLG